MKMTLFALRTLRISLFAAFLAAFLFSVPALASKRNSKQACMHLELSSSYDSSLDAETRRDGVDFVSVNGHPVYFYNDPRVTKRDSKGRAIFSMAEGCFSKGILKEHNIFKLTIVWPYHGGPIKGSGSVKLGLGANPERTLCYLHFFEGAAPSQACQQDISVPLEEIDPDLAAQLARAQELQREVDNLRTSLASLENEVEALERFLREVTGLAFDKIDPEKFKAKELADIYAILKAAKKSIADLKVEAAKILGEAESRETELKSAMEYAAPQLVLPEVPAWTLPELPPTGEGADYTAWSANWIRKLEAAKTTPALLETVSYYLRSRTSLRKALQSSAYAIDELRSFTVATDAVEKVIYETGCGGRGCLTHDGYPKGSPVPQEIRTLVTNTLPNIDEAGAAALGHELRTWEGSLTENQRKVLAVVDALGIAAKHLDTFVTQDLGAAKRKLASVMQGAVEAAKTGFCVVGVVATPVVNDLSDFYEAALGREICTGKKLENWERVLSGVGMIAGSGRFWRTVGNEIEGVGKAWSKVSVTTHTTVTLSRETLAKIRKALEHTPYPPVRIRQAGDKIAIIGRSMGDPSKGLVGVKDAAEALRKEGVEVEIFATSPQAWKAFTDQVDEFRKAKSDTTLMLPYNEVKMTVAYAENAAWARKLKDEGYTVLDLGNPNNLTEDSAFYDVELLIPIPETRSA